MKGARISDGPMLRLGMMRGRACAICVAMINARAFASSAE